MKICLMSSHLGDQRSGGTRFNLALARGLTKLGTQVTLVTLRATAEAKRAVEGMGATLVAGQIVNGEVGFGPLALTRSPRTGRKVGLLAKTVKDADWKVLVSDDSIPCAEELEGDRLAYICNGAFPLLFFSRDFMRTSKFVKRVLSMDASGTIRRNAGHLGQFRHLIGNGKTCCSIASFVYGVPFTGVVHPPVDTHAFRPPSSAPSGEYVLALARNLSESGMDLLDSLARRVPLKVVGGARVAGADCRGLVSDAELIRLYQNARFLTFQPVSEYFGYAIAEAMACGTPSLAFDCCGPSEQIQNEVNGWLVRGTPEFLDRAGEQFKRETSADMRRACVAAAERFSLESEARTLLGILGT